MSTSVALTIDRLEIEPGSSASAEVTVRNTSRVVDEFRCTVLGDAADWSEVTPETVTLLPGGESTVVVTITPPRSSAVLAGPVEFGVRVRPRENPDDAVVEEVRIEVLPFLNLSGELLPNTAVARRWGETQVAIDNRGNRPVEVVLVPSDPDRLVDFRIDPEPVMVAPGEAAFALLRLRGRRRHLTGAPKTLPVTVSVEPDDGDILELSGAVQQLPRIPRWLVRALIVSGIGLLALLIMWFALLKPTLESTARDAVEREVSAAQDAAQDAQVAASEAAGSGADAAGEEAGAEAGAEGEGEEAAAPPPEDTPAAAEPTTEPTPGTSSSTVAQVRPGIDGNPVDFRIAATAAPGATGAASRSVEPERTLSLTDIVLQNPQGDTGRLQVRRGTAVLLEARLENFRDLDYHFVAPIVFTGGQDVGLLVVCERDDGVACAAAGYFAGFETDPPEDEG